MCSLAFFALGKKSRFFIDEKVCRFRKSSGLNLITISHTKGIYFDIFFLLPHFLRFISYMLNSSNPKCLSIDGNNKNKRKIFSIFIQTAPMTSNSQVLTKYRIIVQYTYTHGWQTQCIDEQNIWLEINQSLKTYFKVF